MPAHTLEKPRRFLLSSLAAVALYLGAIWLADPRGEFPLNDDWTYSRSAFALGAGQGLRVDEWAAPTLVGQAILGGLLVSWTGPSFLALRLLTAGLTLLTVLLLMALFRELDMERGLSFAAALAWVFNPLYFSLSLTFMTEVPFLSLIALALWQFRRYLRDRTASPLLAAGAALGYAFLIRQTALLFAAPLLFTLLVEHRPGLAPRRRLRDLALAASPVLLLAGAYYLWLGRSGGATPATMRKFTLLQHLTVEQLVGNSLGIFFYLSFLLLPLWVLLSGRFANSCRDPGCALRVRLTAAAIFTGCALFGLVWFRVRYDSGPYLPAAAFHRQMPFLLNVLFDTGLGPVTLNPTYYLPPATPLYPKTWQAVTLLTAAGSALLGSFVGLRFSAAGVRSLRRRPMLLFTSASFLLVALFEIVFSHLQEGGLFDRHILTLLMPFAVMVLELARTDDTGTMQSRPGRFPRVAAAAVLLAFGWFGVAATHDYLEWNRVRWSLGRELLATGVDPLSVAGGFEFNATHNYDRFHARGNIGKVYHWWYDRQDYMISMHLRDGYDVVRTREYRSWVHRRPLALFLLKKRS